MKAKDCKKCVFCVEVIVVRMWYCRKLGVTVYPDINGSATCCWYQEEAINEAEQETLTDIWP